MNESKKPRGFAAMSPDALRAIAQKGGLAAQATGRAHKWNKETSRAAVAKREAKKNAERPTLPDVSGNDAS